jgi:hypothetical protein
VKNEMILKLFFECHLNITARAFLGTKTTPFAKIVIKLVFSSGRRYLNRVVRAVHIAVVAFVAETAAKTAFSFFNNFLLVKMRIYFLEIFQTPVNRYGFLGESLPFLIVICI